MAEHEDKRNELQPRLALPPCAGAARAIRVFKLVMNRATGGKPSEGNPA